MNKDERGDIGLNVWLKAGGRGTLDYTMQFGKTFVGIKLCKRALARNPESKILILTHSQVSSRNWFKYREQYLDEKANILIMTKNSLINLIEEVQSGNAILDEYAITIIDEIHKFTTHSAYDALLHVNTKYLLGLTGTYPAGEDKKKLDRIAPVVDKITEQEALENGWIAPYREYNLTIEFPDEDKARYIKLTEPIAETLQIFKGTARLMNHYMNAQVFKSDYNVIDSCFRGISTFDRFNKIIRLLPNDIRNLLAFLKGWKQDMELINDLAIQINSIWNPIAIESRARSFDGHIRSRNKLMIMNPLKLQYVTDIVKKFMKPTIIFNEATDFADAVCNAINRLGTESIPICTVYHSNVESRYLRDDRGELIRYKTGERAGQPKLFGKKTLLEDTIDGFISGRYLCISTAKAMDESLSVPNIELVITTGGTTNPITYKQRSGRGKTVNIYNMDKNTIIINIVFDDFIKDVVDDEGHVHCERIRSRDLTKLVERQGESSIAEWVTTIDEIESIC